MIIGISIEAAFALFLPLVLALSYLYFAGLRGWLEGLQKGVRLSVLTGVALLWISLIPGPLTFLGALIASFVLVGITFFKDVKSAVKAFGKILVPTKFVKLLKEGCNSDAGCLARYAAAWPALAALASTTEVVTAPLAMFIIGALTKPPSVKGRLSFLNKIISLVMILVAWAYAIINTLKNLLLPRWLLVQEYALTGEVSKLPLTARLLAKLLGKEAAYLYVAILISLAAYTVVRLHSALEAERRREVMASVSPFVAYAVSMNKLGEPLTSIAYALGMVLAYFMRTRNVDVPKGVVDKLIYFFATVGRRVLEYSVPLGPLRRLLS